METVEVTSISSRGQVVIPRKIIEKLHLHEGEKFVVIGEEDTIVFKKLGMSYFKGFDQLVKKTRKFVKNKGLKETDIEESIRKLRKK